MNTIADILAKNTNNLPQHNLTNQTSEPPKKEEPANNTSPLPFIKPEPKNKEESFVKDSLPKKPMVTNKKELNIKQIKTILNNTKDQINAVLRMLDGEIVNIPDSNTKHQVLETGEHIIEGVFNGQHMIGEDGKEYPVHPNYASKSKLVEGDLLKLTITNRGSYIFKQIGPIQRKRLIGELIHDINTTQWSVLVNGKTYKILTASVTFFKGNPGDSAVILLPENGESAWGAVDNILPKHSEHHELKNI